MAHQLIIVRTTAVMRAHEEGFQLCRRADLPLMVVVKYLLDCLVQDEGHPLAKDSLIEGIAFFFMDIGLMSERVTELFGQSAFTNAVYALYQALYELSGVIRHHHSAPGHFLSAISPHGWQAGDLVISQEISSYGPRTQPAWTYNNR